MEKEVSMKLNRILTIVIGCLLAAMTAFGQTTGGLSGTVASSGSPLPGATVTVTSPSLQGSRTAVTDASGNYTVTDLPPGDYTVRFELQGLAPLTKQASVALSQTARVDADLQPRKPGDREQFAEEVTVTGTMIPRPTLEAMSPVTTLDVEELSYRGINRLEDLLNSLPQVFAAQNSTVSNGASGTATVDLRYLGTTRTLVLIDGRRMSAGDAFATAPDLNFIPAALVKRVDILTGGASSVYGADAVAGVVNFVLDKDFEGVRASVSGGSYQHNNNNAAYQAMNTAKGFSVPSGSVWDGKNYDASLALGGKFADGKGHASAYLDYRKTDALLKGARDYTNCSVLGGMTMAGPTCGGSGTWQYGRFQVFSPDFSSRKADLVLDSTTGNTMRARKGSDVYNYAPANYMQRPDVRIAGGGFVNYEFNKHAEGYVEAMLMSDMTDAQIAPSGDFNNTEQLNCDNPMLSAQQVQTLCTNNGYAAHDIANVVIGRRNVEGGGRDSILRHDDFRLVGGLKGEINKAWSYDAYALDAEVHSPQRYANDFNVNHIQDALIVDGNPNDPSTWHCRSGNAGCAPWNIFKTGGVTKEALAYLQLPEVLESGTKTSLFSARATGDLRAYGLAFPSASEGVKIALGTEFRKESLFVAPDLAFQEALGAGSGGPTLPVSGSFRVKEYFVEGLIPIVQGAPMAKDLSMELGYRHSTYSINGSFPSWKVQGSYAPVASLKFRAGINRATRAPNVQELFVPQGLGLGGSSDPCAGTNPTFTAAQCALTGVPANLYGKVPENPAQQYNTLGGGNPNLTPEIADTKSVGLVFTPAAFSGFSAALDFYDIKIKDTIGSLGADDIIKQCAATGNPALCSLIHRDVAGTLWLFQSGYTLTTNQNIGKLGSRGLDVNVSYMMPTAKVGFFSFNLIGTRLMHSTIDTGLYSYDCVGFYGNQCGVPSPKWRHLARASWETPFNTVFSLGWRMLGAAKVDESSSNPALANPEDIPLLKANNIASLPVYNWFDLAATYKFSKGVQWNIGVNNILDKEPPLGAGMSPNDYGAGFYNTYDSYGRYVHTSLNFNF
jgi:outer membrane receptor protein involved in Fe transport